MQRWTTAYNTVLVSRPSSSPFACLIACGNLLKQAATLAWKLQHSNGNERCLLAPTISGSGMCLVCS